MTDPYQEFTRPILALASACSRWIAPDSPPSATPREYRTIRISTLPSKTYIGPMPSRDTGPRCYLMPLVKVFHPPAVIRSTGPDPWSLVSRMATRPGALATATHCPPCPPLYDDFRQF